jgi:hypothetical protein
MAHQHDMNCLKEVGGQLVCSKEPAGAPSGNGSGKGWKVKGVKDRGDLWMVDTRSLEQALKLRGVPLWHVSGGNEYAMPPSSPHVGDVHVGFLTAEQPDPGETWFYSKRVTHAYVSPGYGERGREVSEIVRGVLSGLARHVGSSEPRKIHGRVVSYDIFELPQPVTTKESNPIAKSVRQAVMPIVEREETRMKKSAAESDTKAAEHRKKIAGLATGTHVKVFFPTMLGIGGAQVGGVIKQAGPVNSAVTCLAPGKKRRGSFIVPNNHIWVA